MLPDGVHCVVSQEVLTGLCDIGRSGRSIAIDVAHGLAYLHDNHILHLDIKASPASHPDLRMSL